MSSSRSNQSSTESADRAENAVGDEDDAEMLDVGDVLDATAEVVEGEAEVSFESFRLPRKSTVPKSAALTTFDPLQAYMQEIQRHALLTPEEEHAIAARYAETGDVEAAAHLVSANLRLVVKIAYEYRRAYRNVMDLIQEGNIGLMQAVKRYDPYRGVKLSSYAALWIRAYILRFVLNNWRLVKLGTTQAQRRLFYNLNKEKARLVAMGIEPSPEEIAKRLRVNEKDVVEMDRRLSSREASLDAPVGDTDGRAVSRVELMAGAGRGPDEILATGQVNSMVHESMVAFRQMLTNEKDIAIFDKRLIAEDPVTLQDLGEMFGISRERVRQLETRVLSRLREHLKADLGDAVGTG